MIQNSDAKWTYHPPAGRFGVFFSLAPASVSLLGRPVRESFGAAQFPLDFDPLLFLFSRRS
jgi:hypothetical protein